MKQYIIWNKITKTTFEQRNQMTLYISHLINIKYDVEKYGIYGFKNFLNSEADHFEKIAIWLISNGYKSEICEEILLKIINSSNLSNEQYLKYIIFCEFVVAIQNNPKELELKLLSYLGIEFMNKYFLNQIENYFSDWN